MKIFIIFLWSLSIQACTHLPQMNDVDLQEIARMADQMNNDAITYQERHKQAQLFIDNHIDPLSKVDTAEWTQNRIYFDSLARINFYLTDQRLNPLLEKLYWKLRSSGFANNEDASTVYEYYLISRQHDEATLFYKKLPDFMTKDFPSVPVIHSHLKENTGPLLLKIKTSQEAEIEPFPMSQFSGVVIIGSPNCHFTQKALAALLKDNNPQFFSNAVIIHPQNLIDFKTLLKWNHEHPSIPYKIAYQERAFNLFMFNQLPTFYFLKNGSVLFSFSGWDNKKNNFEKIKEGLSKI